MSWHPTKLPLGVPCPIRAGRYLDQLARYWKKKRKPLDGPEPNRDGTMWLLYREDWRALGSKSFAELAISWSAAEPEYVGVFLDYDDEATSDKERWFKLGTPSAKLWEFAKDPGVGPLGRMAENPRSYHAAGFGMDYDLVSPQKARSLLTAAHGKARRLPRPGYQIRLDDHSVLTNRAGQYEVDHR